MPYDGNGNYVRTHNWTADAANGLDISATEMDQEDNSIAAAISIAVTRDGQGKMGVDFLPNADNTLSLGSGAVRWASLNGTPISQIIPTQQGIGGLLSPRTAAEIAAGVTPVNFAYAPGHVYRYGANTTPNTTDMTTAIQAALNQSGQTGGAAAYLPVGIHKTTATLNLIQYARFYGEGFLSQINYAGSGVAVLATAATITNWRRAMVQRLYVNNTGTGTDGIQVNNIGEFELAQCVFQGFSNAGIHLTGTAGQACINIWVHHNECISNTGQGLLIDGVNNLNQITLHSNRFQGNTGYGVKVAVAGKGISIVGNDIEGNTAGQFYLSGGNVAGVDISGNYFENTVNQPSILLSDTQAAFGVSIRGNYFQTDIATTNVIFIGNSGAGASGVEISGNSFLGTITNAINANIVQNSRLGPNYVQTGTHVLLGTTSGVEVVDATGVTLNAGLASKRFFPTYGTTVAIDCAKGWQQVIQVTDGVAFTVAAPTNLVDGTLLTITIISATGGALGVVTWNAAYHLAGAWTQPGVGAQRSITFQGQTTSVAKELYRTAADVA